MVNSEALQRKQYKFSNVINSVQTFAQTCLINLCLYKPREKRPIMCKIFQCHPKTMPFSLKYWYLPRYGQQYIFSKCSQNKDLFDEMCIFLVISAKTLLSKIKAFLFEILILMCGILRIRGHSKICSSGARKYTSWKHCPSLIHIFISIRITLFICTCCFTNIMIKHK